MDQNNDYLINGQVANVQSEAYVVEGIDQVDETEEMENTLRLKHQVSSGAGWFYWIAALSMVNTITYVLNYDWSFINGLGITQIIDGIAYEFTGGLKVAFFGADVFIALIFVYLGYCAGKRKNWAFIVGLIAYTLDALIFFLVNDFLSIGFHVFALFGIFTGLKASKQLIKVNAK